ncbi:hypothetical protein [Amaricoccus macauensis]|uniref:hypothetical protein n=1 Tax=Amaricoccus macauensis TaxID=57001 RepID=UPI003C7E8C34
MFDDLGGISTLKEWTTAHPRLRVDYFGAERRAGMEAEAIAQAKELQCSKLDLVTRVIIGKASREDPVSIYASLEGSGISTGPSLWDSPLRKGYFRTRVAVSLYLTDLRGERRIDFTRIADGPDTGDGGENTRSSVGFDHPTPDDSHEAFFDIDSGRAIESTPPLGFTSPRTITGDLGGFRVINSAPRHGARHEYVMCSSSGGSYENPRDLVQPHAQAGLFDFISGSELHTPPACATNRLPLISQCIWQADSARAMAETVYLNIDVTQSVTCVSTERARAGGHPDTETITLSYHVEEPVPLGLLLAS